MRDHSECEQAYHQALAADKPGRAEWILTRCDRAHGHLTAGTDRVAPVRAALAAERDDAEEAGDR